MKEYSNKFYPNELFHKQKFGFQFGFVDWVNIRVTILKFLLLTLIK